MSGLEHIFDRSAALAYARQKRFKALVGDCLWWVDPQNGIARLYTKERELCSGDIKIQVLGSEAVAEGYWKWEWANSINAVPQRALTAVEVLRDLGKDISVPELVTPEVPTDGLVSPETMGALGVALFDAPAYFIHSVGGGRLRFAILVDETFRTPENPDLGAVALTIAEVAAAGLPLTRIQTVIAGYLFGLGIPYEELPDGNIVAQTATQQLRVDIDGNAFSFKLSAR